MSKLTWKEKTVSDYFNDETYRSECNNYQINYDRDFCDYSVCAKVCKDGRFGPIGIEFATFEEAEEFLLNWIELQEKVEESKSSETSIVIEEVEYVLHVTDQDVLNVYDPTTGHTVYEVENISSPIDRKRTKENWLKAIIQDSNTVSKWNSFQDQIVESYWNDESFQAGDFQISVLKNRIEIYGVNKSSSLYFQVIDTQSCDSAEEVSSLPEIYKFFKNYVLTQK